MASEDFTNKYEEMRQRNIERNNNMLQSLGLCALSTSFVDSSSRIQVRRQRQVNCMQTSNSPRRSPRILANSQVTCSTKQRFLQEPGSPSTQSNEERFLGKSELHNVLHGNLKRSIMPQGVDSTMEKEEFQSTAQEFYSSDSSESMFEAEFHHEGEHGNSVMASRLVSGDDNDEGHVKGSAICLDSLKSMTPAAFGSHFQELVIQALMQSTRSLTGSSSSMHSSQEGVPANGVAVPKVDNSLLTTWNQSSFNKFEAQRNKRPLMTRTSAGEGTDSQEDFPIPENESPHARSIRTRRLNRSRARKAKELTSNRKAMKMLPYVIHVDGTGRAKGIHKHLWRAAVRGQCGRLDPSMDNINHHAKNVVDSIWHALEKEWEFEGFAHRAREMFERSATKFMRNRKMQLKKKARKTMHEDQPTDVSPNHWKKIVQLSKESSKQSMSKASLPMSLKKTFASMKVLQERKEGVNHFQGQEEESRSRSPKGQCVSTTELNEEAQHVDDRIRNLKRELLELENAKKKTSTADASMKGKAVWRETNGCGEDVREDEEGMKENVLPRKGGGPHSSTVSKEVGLIAKQENINGSALYVDDKRKLVKLNGLTRLVEGGGPDLSDGEMDCGDLVSLLAMRGGEKIEIGKALVMALSGSKYVRKVIPKGWRLVKVYTFTVDGASEVCPFPAQWADQVKYKTVKDAEGRNIVWPDNLLRP